MKLKKILVGLLCGLFLMSTCYSLTGYAKHYNGLEEMISDPVFLLDLLDRRDNPADFKLDSNKYKVIAYEEIMRERDGLVDIPHTFYATVQQYDESEGIGEGLFKRDDDLSQAYYFAMPNLSSTRLMDGDVVDVYGTLKGLLTYETVMGGRKTVPVIVVEELFIQGVDY